MIASSPSTNGLCDCFTYAAAMSANNTVVGEFPELSVQQQKLHDTARHVFEHDVGSQSDAIIHHEVDSFQQPMILPNAENTAEYRKLILSALADTASKQNSWRWPNPIFGKRISMLAGRTGKGNSFIAIDAIYLRSG